MQYAWGLLSLLLFSVILPAQEEISFLASTDGDRIVPGQVFTLSYSISNVQVDQFSPPDLQNFEVISGPNRSSQISIINGQRSMSFTYRYQLIPERAGNFTIPPARAKTKKGLLVSNAIEIEVVPAAQQPSGKDNQDFFLRLEVNRDTPYVGEQLLLDYVLYTRTDIENVYTLKDVDLDGFYHTNINRFPSAVTQSSYEGRAYSRQILKRLALYPQRSGSFELGPLVLRLDISQGNRQRPFSFFRNVVKKEASAPAISIQVASIPEPVAAGFSGGVGRYSMQARAEAQETTVGAAIELEVRVEGDGDPNVLDAPELWISGPAEGLQPNLRFEDEQVHQGKRSFVKTFSYLIIPEETGKFEVTPTLITLDPTKGYYDTLKAETTVFWANPKGQQEDNTQDSSYSPNETTGNSIWAYVAAGFLVLLFGISIGWRALRGRRKNENNKTHHRSHLLQEIQAQIESGNPQLNRIRNILTRWEKDTSENETSTVQRWLKEVDFQQYNPQQNTSDQLEWLRKLEGDLGI